MSKKLPIVAAGTAVKLDDRVLRLCDLSTLDSACPHLTEATQIEDRVELRFENGRVATVSIPSSAFGATADLVISGAHQVLTCADGSIGLRTDTRVACAQGRVLAVYQGSHCPVDVSPTAIQLDAKGCIVTPGLVDPHTHPVFIGERSVEFGLKASGASYLEIHKAGGGIHSTVTATRAAGPRQLESACLGNLARLLSWGVTTCEGKSGYALTLEGELALLQAMQAAANRHAVDVIPTLLGAHALPSEYAHSRDEYVAIVAEQMVPQAAQTGLACYCDAYCEDGAFTTDEVRKIFAAASAVGLGLRLHAEQFTNQGAARLGAELGAATVDHLEAIDDDDIDALAASGTTAVILPGAALACRAPWPPVSKLVEAGVPIALGTDLNPGSSMCASLPLMMSLACMQMGLSVELAWRAVTIEAARSLGRDDIGRIVPGARADFAIFAAPDYRYIPYHYGENHLRFVVKSGQVVIDRSRFA